MDSAPSGTSAPLELDSEIPNLRLVYQHALDPGDALDRLVAQLTTDPDVTAMLESIRAAPFGADVYLHPGASPIELRMEPGLLRVSAHTLAMGPAYHALSARSVAHAAEAVGFRAAHDRIDSFLASDQLDATIESARAYWESELARARSELDAPFAAHAGVHGIRLSRSGGITPRRDGLDGSPEDHALMWDGSRPELELWRALYQLRFTVPRREPRDEIEVEAIESILDDLEAAHDQDADHPDLVPLRGAWRLLSDWVAWKRERPSHLQGVAPDDSLLGRHGLVRLRAHERVWVTLPGEFVTRHPQPGVFWGEDNDAQLWVETQVPDLAVDDVAADELLEAVADWGPTTERGERLFLEWSDAPDGESGRALSAAAWLGDRYALLTAHVPRPNDDALARAESWARSLSSTPR